MPDREPKDKSETKPISRREALKKDGIEHAEMPPCDAPHLLDWFFEMGPTVPAGMGEGPITQGEILAWQVNSGIDLQPWEARFMRRLSIEYLSESGRARDRNCPPPWKDTEQVQVHRPPARVAGDLQAHIRRLASM